MNKKIFYIADWFNNIQRNLLNNLDSDIDVTIILSDKFSKHQSGNYEIKVFPTRDLINITLNKKKIHEYFLIYKKDLFEYIQKEKPDLIICNLWYKFSTIQIANYCKKNNIPFIIQTEMQRYPKSILGQIYIWIEMRLFKRIIFDNAKYILPWTISSYDFFNKQKIIKDKTKIKLIPAAINTKIFYRINKKKTNPKKYQLLCIGRFVEFKRHTDLIKAIIYIRDKYNIKVNLDIIGKGYNPALTELSIEKKLKMIIIKNNLSNQIRFIDSVPYEELNKLYCQYDTFVLPSYNEPIGMVVPEAMACGVPVIVSDTCGAKTYVVNGKNGYLFKTYDVVDLAEKILLLRDEARREKFGHNATEHIKKNYNISVVNTKFKKIIKSVITNINEKHK